MCIDLRYNMAKPTAKLSDAMINALMTEGLIDSSARVKSPEVMMAAHKHLSHEADPPAKMNAMCTQAQGATCGVAVFVGIDGS